MAIIASLCDDDDFYRLFSITSDAFGYDQPYIDAIYPNHHDQAGRQSGAERLAQMAHTDPANRFTKATDTATGLIIGHAKWIIFADGKPEETPLTGDFWETQEDKEYAAHLYKEFVKPRRETARAVGGPLVCSFLPY